MTEIKLAYGRQFARTKDGGWLEVGATLPKSSTAKISGDAIVFKRAARDMWGGTFMGGTFRGGDFCGGRFWGGEFNGGTFMGGEFNGGTFMGGYFRGGTFNLSPACAQRSDGYMFVAHFVEGELRIWAGCRNFSWNEAIDHWSDDHDHGAETQRIIHFLKAQAQAAKGIDYPNMETPA